MPPSSRIPPLLQPYTRLPTSDSILVVTSTLGATANWLLVRFLSDALSAPPTNAYNCAQHDAEDVNVVLVSWMREYDFWRQEARKGVGLDLERLKKEGRFAFVDGLGGLFAPPPVEYDTVKDDQMGMSTAAAPARGATSLPVRGPAPGRMLPARGPPVGGGGPAASAPRTNAATPTQRSASSNAKTGVYTLTSPSLEHLQTTITSALSHLSSTTSSPARKTLLVLDNPDILLAAVSPNVTPFALSATLLTLHKQVSHMLIHLQADTPLVSLSTPPQPLEVNQHNFLVKVAHMSRRILSVRALDTGVARDVSGVLRVTEQRDNWVDIGPQDAGEEGRDENEGTGKEVLYLVKGDGSVRVFERGAGGEG